MVVLFLNAWITKSWTWVQKISFRLWIWLGAHSTKNEKTCQRRLCDLTLFCDVQSHRRVQTVEAIHSHESPLQVARTLSPTFSPFFFPWKYKQIKVWFWTKTHIRCNAFIYTIIQSAICSCRGTSMLGWSLTVRPIPSWSEAFCTATR